MLSCQDLRASLIVSTSRKYKDSTNPTRGCIICLVAVYSPFRIEKNDVTFTKFLLFVYAGEFFLRLIKPDLSLNVKQNVFILMLSL